MKSILVFFSFYFFCTTFFSQIDVDKYLWEYPLQEELVLNNELVNELRSHFDNIIESGDLFFRPLPCRYHDQLTEHYFLYKEPSRILQTIADAYPYLREDQKNTIRPMVAELLNDPIHRPWSMNLLSEVAGKNREPYESEVLWGEGNNYQRFRPTIQNVYAVWSYIYRTHDTLSIAPHYEDIRNFYQQKALAGSDRGDMYGTLSAHIGMARLANIFGDDATIQSARNRLVNLLDNAINIDNIDQIAAFGTSGWDAPYGEEYTQRKDQFIYRGYIFLNMSPEIGRFIKDHVFESVVERHQFGLERFPLWWLRQAPYFSRWTGDEGIGFPSESFGMFFPVERWVLNSEASRLSGFMRSAPIGIADSYWLEALINTIEAGGTDVWVDVREKSFEVDFVMGLPEVVTSEISNISQATATSGGVISHDGGSPIQNRGVVWNNSGQPDLTSAIGITEDGTGIGSFISELQQLEPDVAYYVRAYATNEIGTSYGNTLTFTTLRNTLSIIATHGDGGIIEPSGSISVFENDSILFIILPDDDYEIDELLVDGLNVGPLSEFLFERVTNNHEIHASFSIITNLKSSIDTKLNLSLYPNPTASEIIINIGENDHSLMEKHFSLMIIDNSGKPIRKQDLYSHYTVINLSELPSGIYLFQISDGEAQYEKQIFLIR